MKHFYFILAFVLPVFIQAQCVADAGPDQHGCLPLMGQNQDTLVLGGQPAASGGTAPYTYSWTFVNSPGTILNLQASYFLNDTSLANPQVNLQSAIEDTLTFVLTVLDGNSAICRDTVAVTLSHFSSHLGQYGITVNAGDTLTLPFGPNLMGNLPVQGYLWRPHHGMIDSTSINPTLAPTQSMVYHVVVTDSAGCTAVGGDFVFVTVEHLETVEIQLARQIEVFPNPVHRKLQVKFPDGLASTPLDLEITDASGRAVKRFHHSGKLLMQENISLKDGIYFLHFFRDGDLLATKKLLVTP